MSNVPETRPFYLTPRPRKGSLPGAGAKDHHLRKGLRRERFVSQPAEGEADPGTSANWPARPNRGAGTGCDEASAPDRVDGIAALEGPAVDRHAIETGLDRIAVDRCLAHAVVDEEVESSIAVPVGDV